MSNNSLAQLYRTVALKVAAAPIVEDTLSRQGWALAQRFVSGKRVEDAIVALEALQKRRIFGNLDLLGEFVSTPGPANANTELILEAIQKVKNTGFVPYNSIKLSSIGQGQKTEDGRDLGDVNARKIVAKAKECGGFVNLDMEDHPRVDETLRLFRELVAEFGTDHVGTVLQAYLHRTEQDLADLAPLKANLRIVKGAYLEPESVALQNKADIDAAYLNLVQQHLQNGGYCNVATHDHDIMYKVMQWTLAHGISRNQYEFQLLYGVREDLQTELASDGFTVRSYVPFGEEWYGYYSRRIAEKPQNVMFVLRGLLG